MLKLVLLFRTAKMVKSWIGRNCCFFCTESFLEQIFWVVWLRIGILKVEGKIHKMSSISWPSLLRYMQFIFKKICNISRYLLKILNSIAYFYAWYLSFLCPVMKTCCLPINVSHFWSFASVSDLHGNVSYGQKNWQGLLRLWLWNFS